MPVYRTQGTLTGTIENVGVAQDYLTKAEGDAPLNMAKYLWINSEDPKNDDAPEGLVEWMQWALDSDGHRWSVTMVTTREATEEELKKLSGFVSGQNSDGLGEGFEQQDFAWESEGDCGECGGCENGWGCEDESGRMISFDWQTNKCEWEKLS